MLYYLPIKVIVLEEKMAIHIDVSKLDELILLINNSADEKQKRILLGKATEVYGRGGAMHVKELTGLHSLPCVLKISKQTAVMRICLTDGSTGKERGVNLL